MVANPIPGLITCSVNTEKTMAARNAGNEHVVATWGDNPKFMLREYLLTNCAQVRQRSPSDCVCVCVSPASNVLF